MELLTINQYAKKTGIPECAVRRLHRNGELPGFYSGTRFYINVEKANALFEEKRSSPKIKEQPVKRSADIEDDDFGTILICAVRYTLGRRTYMPHIVISYIRPLLSQLTDKTLACLEKDIDEQRNAGGYGDPMIDEPEWLRFLEEIKRERRSRSDNEFKKLFEHLTKRKEK